MSLSSGADRVIIHTHTPALIALTCALDLDTMSLSRLLWEMHTECMLAFPSGCGFVPWEAPGGDALAAATANVLKQRTLVIWQFHGILGAGPDLDAVFGLIETAEKAAQIYIHAQAAGGVLHRLSRAQLESLAQAFGVSPDPHVLGND